jgi:hypothetical protein
VVWDAQDPVSEQVGQANPCSRLSQHLESSYGASLQFRLRLHHFRPWGVLQVRARRFLSMHHCMNALFMESLTQYNFLAGR